ncbi:MAG: MarR family transcriptional regulator [Alphaproteobacteria bacterium]|nr:MAG: MarR family transcriptional regulator [Alphaproteobacteria bacterium]
MTQQNANKPVPLDDQVCYAIYSAGMAIQRLYKPLLDQLGLTYSQYLVLNVLWRDDEQTVGKIGEKLALESSTLTPLLKRLEAAGLLRRTRNPDNERQVVIALTEQGRALQSKAGCLGDALLESSGETPAELGALNREIRRLRENIYARIGGWALPE